MANFLLSKNWKVIGLDAITKYYDPKLKMDRHKILKKNKNFHAYTGFLEDEAMLDELYAVHRPNIIIHFAAQPGVRYSIENPQSYVQSNLIGTFNILECAKKYPPDHLLFASTSSVYGNNKKKPFNENQKSDTPISFYAATKKSNEVIAHSYSHLFKIPITVFRFFTVYGTWGRPDMALFKFTHNILSGFPIDIHNYGKMKRDFTNVEDLVKAVSLLIDIVPLSPENRKIKFKLDSISDTAPYRVVNIGSSTPYNIMDYIHYIENALQIKAKKKFIKMQDGEVKETYSNVDLLYELTGFIPKKNIQTGILEFVDWYKKYYKINV